MKFRIGHGVDIHAYQPGDHVMLGGVKVPYTKSVRAHSDGDVVLHAITDALLGALGMGDIGQWFPDTDPNLSGIASTDLIKPVIMAMRSNGYQLNNLDVTVVAQSPRISEYSDAIKNSIASIFGVDADIINLKGTSTEKLGAIGREEGISAHAVISIIGKTEVDQQIEHLIEDTSKNEVINEVDITGLIAEEEIDLSQEIDIRDFNFNDTDKYTD